MENAYWFGIVIVLQLLLLARSLQGQSSRLEAKVNLILKHLGIEAGSLSERVKEIARDPSRKIEAIKVHRQETGVGLAEAKDAVELWMSTQGK